MNTCNFREKCVRFVKGTKKILGRTEQTSSSTFSMGVSGFIHLAQKWPLFFRRPCISGNPLCSKEVKKV